MMFSQHTINRSRAENAGFTIIELLVASAVTSVIAMIMVAMISSILTSWGRLSGTLSTGGEARLVLDIMAEDLQSAYYRSDGNVWLAATVLHGGGADGIGNSGVWSTEHQNHLKPIADTVDYLRVLPDLGDPFDVERTRWRYGTAGTWLRFFTAGPDPQHNQLPKAVGYQIVRREVSSANDAEIRYMLYRSVVDPVETMEVPAGYHITAPEYMAPGAANQGAPNTILRPHYNSVIASNVIDFGVRFYVRDDVGNLDLVFPYPGAGPTPGAGAARNYLAGSANADFPHVADIFIRVLTPEGEKLIRNHEALPAGITPPQQWWEIAEAHSRVYIRRVHLGSGY